MLNKNSFKAVDKAHFTGSFIRPLADDYCFSNIPQFILDRFSGKRNSRLPLDVLGNLPRTYKKIVFFLIDGFGWRFFEKYKERYLFLKRFLTDGVVSKITTQFPSTTTAQITTIHTGAPTSHHGLYEWFYYEPELDAIIAPLLFSFAGKGRGNLTSTGINPKKLYPTGTFYKTLLKNEVVPSVFDHVSYVNSPYNRIIFDKALVIPYRTLPEALTNLSQVIQEEKRKSYYFFYFGDIDGICHQYGPNSPQLDAEVHSLLTNLEDNFMRVIYRKPKDCLFLVTADHGHIEADPKKTVYLDKEFPGIKKYLKTNKKGEFLVPAGSARDMFLYVHDKHLEKAVNYLQKKLQGIAEIYKTSYLIKQGFFGSKKPAKTFMDRVGNLVILPFANEMVWWSEKDKFKIQFLGHHGGLTREEMEIPFLLMNFD
ncbi:phosphodiesterase [Candidatus Roizmanbacteria bacterium CG09_land_8_20_14_0_10_41_9]|uniref:Phosphodiesterase n=1 Tax=Candidatus Roizmanbacteria bacterium CG09_land_8_20_14_0_10_41_9 TaxID=1974850 RepID=A0A2H0WSC6_9BACT|nr:MAG: phosphodiesterase [Candidatus Roizmanbacteria bacterium CG09_land_8_20_14_0_10_41_9]